MDWRARVSELEGKTEPVSQTPETDWRTKVQKIEYA